MFLERVSAAIEHVDGSSGSIGNAVNRAVAALVPIIATAPTDAATKEGWLERLFQAHADDEIPYIEQLDAYWGDLCGTPEIASAWADRLVGITRMALSPDPAQRGHFHGTMICLSALFRAGRHEELVELVSGRLIFPYKRWAAKAMGALGKVDEAIAYAEAAPGINTSYEEVAATCEEILVAAGRIDEARERYGSALSLRSTYLASFRAAVKKQPDRAPEVILAEPVKTTPGNEGKWFAAAKSAGLYEEALSLARRSPCDPRTLARAARDFEETNPRFSVGAGLLALYWLSLGYGYEITGADVVFAFTHTMNAAERAGVADQTRVRILEIVAGAKDGGFVAGVLRGTRPT